MVDILHKIRIECPPSKVYDALTTTEGLSKWYTKWTTLKEGNGEVGSVIRFGFGGDKYESLFKVMKLEKDKFVEWACMDKPGEWSFSGTKISFKLNEEEVEFYDNKKMTVIKFVHSGFKKRDDLFIESNSRWAFFILSMKYYIENGKGAPVPDDIYM